MHELHQNRDCFIAAVETFEVVPDPTELLRVVVFFFRIADEKAYVRKPEC
jgi:hypothetical protein